MAKMNLARLSLLAAFAAAQERIVQMANNRGGFAGAQPGPHRMLTLHRQRMTSRYHELRTPPVIIAPKKLTKRERMMALMGREGIVAPAAPVVAELTPYEPMARYCRKHRARVLSGRPLFPAKRLRGTTEAFIARELAVAA